LTRKLRENKCFACDFKETHESCVAVKPRINKYKGIELCDRCVDYLDGQTVWSHHHCVLRKVGDTPVKKLETLKRMLSI